MSSIHLYKYNAISILVTAFLFLTLYGCTDLASEKTEKRMIDLAVVDAMISSRLDLANTDLDTDLANTDLANTDLANTDLGLPAQLMAGQHEFTLITATQHTRRYIVHVPTSVEPNPAVVLLLHGGGGSAAGAQRDFQFDLLADQHGFITVYPEGTSQGNESSNQVFATWNGGGCCGDADANNIDDVSFIAQLLDDLVVKHSYDIRRVYATGISNGGLMSHRLACELSERITAIAPVAAPTTDFPCEPTRTVPVLIIHGTDDRCANYEGGEACGGCFQRFLSSWLNQTIEENLYTCSSTHEGVERWRTRNQCADESMISYENGKARCESWLCAMESAVTFCVVEDMGHQWPSGLNPEFCAQPNSRRCQLWIDEVGEISQDISSEQIWSFFTAHTLVNP